MSETGLRARSSIFALAKRCRRPAASTSVRAVSVSSRARPPVATGTASRSSAGACEEWLDDLAAVQPHRPVLPVVHVRRRIDAQDVIDRGTHVIGGIGLRGRVGADLVGLADDLATADAG